MRTSNRGGPGRMVLAAAALVLTVACATEEPQARTESLTEPTTVAAEPAEPTLQRDQAETASPPPAPSGGEGTTPERPVPAGRPVTVGNWQVSITGTITDAAAQVMAENMFNDPPPAGRQFVMARANLVYRGPASAVPRSALEFQVVAAGNTYGRFDDRCGVIPNGLNSMGEMFSGAAASGNICVSVPAADLAGAVWMVDARQSTGDSRVFIAFE